MPSDHITDVVIDGEKLDQQTGPRDKTDKTEKKTYLRKLQLLKSKGGDQVNKGGMGALGRIDTPGPTVMADFDTLDKTEQKLKDALAAAVTLEKDLTKGAGETMCVADFNAIRDGKERHKQAGEFKEALEKVPTVAALFTTIERAAAVRMDEAVERDKKNGKPVPKAPTPDQWNALRLKAMQGRSNIRAMGLPSGYEVAEGPLWNEVLLHELKPFYEGKDEAENQQKRKDALAKALDPAATKKGNDAAKSLQEVMKKYQVRGSNRASNYFDATRNGVPMSEEDTKKAKEAIEEIVKRATDILNNGGNLKQVKEMLAGSGLSEEFWPPQLVQSIQAWRKTSRALQEERVRKLNADSKKGGKVPEENISLAMTMVGGFTELDEAMRDIHTDQSDGKDTSGLIETCAKNAEVLKTVGEWLNGTASGIGGLVSGAELIKTIVEMVKTGQENTPAMEKALKELDLGMEALAKSLSMTKAGFDMAKDFGGPAVQEFVKKIVPGLGLAVAGVEFANAVKDLAKNSRTLAQTRGQKNEGLSMFVTDSGGVDESMLGAMNNALGAERTKVTKSGIKVGTSGMEVGGNAASTFGGHFGAAAGSAISITATGIDMGAKAIFSGIDWSQAKKAKALLAEARAGNMEAQVQIFEKSNLYAKMLLAISVKEGSPLAKKYVFDRGIEEGDLNEPLALEILRDAMLDAAEQSNDQEVEDNIVMHFTGRLGKAVVGVGKATGDAVVNVKDRVVRAATKTYDPAAKYTVPSFPAKIDEWTTTWESAKKTLIAHGMVDDATGLTEALTKAAEADKAADLQPDDQKARETLIAALASVNKVVQLTLQAKPVGFQAQGSPKRVPHQKAYEALKELRGLANEKTESYWKRLDVLPGADPNWAPAPIADITAAEWDKFWKAGQKAVSFPADDAGVDKAIKDAATAKTAFDNEKNDDKVRRKLNVAYVAELDDLNEALLDCLGLEEVNRREKARAAINDFMLKINEERRRVDAWLAGKMQDGVTDDWAGPTPAFAAPDKYLEEWNGMLDYADEAGFMATKEERGKGNWDGGLTEVVGSWQDSYAAYLIASKVADKPAERLAAVRSLQEDAGRVKKRTLQFMRVQKASADQVKAYTQAMSDALLKTTVSTVEAEEAIAAKITFDNVPKKSYLSSEDWRNVHDDAVAKGALLKSGTGRKALSQALKAQRSALEAYEKGKKSKGKDKAKTMRPLATAYLEAMNETEGTVEMVRGLKRYGENALMKAYLDGIKKAIETARTNAAPDLEKYAHGTSVGPLTFTAKLDTAEWSKSKDLAISNGVIADRTTGIKGALADYIKVKAGTDAEKIKKSAMTLRPLLEDVGNDTANKDWVGYIEKMLGMVTV
jgi:hypothetical protein